MKYSTKVSDAVHILAFIQLNPTGSLSSSSIAESIRTNPDLCASLCLRFVNPDFCPVYRDIPVLP